MIHSYSIYVASLYVEVRSLKDRWSRVPDNCYQQAPVSTKRPLYSLVPNFRFDSSELRGWSRSALSVPCVSLSLARLWLDCMCCGQSQRLFMILNLHFYELISRKSRAALMNTPSSKFKLKGQVACSVTRLNILPPCCTVASRAVPEMST